jgi:uncharacterized protein YggE
MISHRRLLAAVTLALGISGTAMAQFHEQGVVSGTGVVTISRPTETMRLQIAIMGRGATLKDALKALKERVEDAKGELEDLGADKATIKVESSKIMEVQNNPQQQMQMMMMQRMKQAGKASKRATVAPPVIVTAMLTAEWKLTAKDPEELLLAVNPLQEKIKAADLSGSKEADKLTPEQEELMEEMQ